jgi:hypothetical protein
MDIDDQDDPERSYRRGYTHGAWNVYEALAPRLSAIERERFEDWFREAREWRLAAMGGESKREVNERAISPPRAGLAKVLSKKLPPHAKP